ncbi:MAG: Ig-like domain-containing protein [Plesiomonas sp.]|uniref:Ig-like domain-containing protein n=1 Tax=Plesiomonas sp. TaxID=2486279 RepID=UPI003EE4DCB9
MMTILIRRWVGYASLFLCSMLLIACGGENGDEGLLSGPKLLSIQIVPAKHTMPIGGEKQYTAIGTYSGNLTRDITQLVTWRSENTAIATIAQQGMASAVSAGKTAITALLSSDNNTVSAQATLIIWDAALARIEITPAVHAMPVGSTKQYTATGIYANGLNYPLTDQVQWTFSTPDIAAIDSKGKVTGLRSGKVRLSATWSQPGYEGTVITSNEASLTVWDSTLTRIDITPVKHTMPVGGTVQYTATAVYENDRTYPVTDKVVWSVGTTGIASNNTKGVATGLSSGKTTVTASWSQPEYPEVVITSKEAKLTVWDAALARIDITPITHFMPVNGAMQYTATGVYGNGLTQNITDKVSWLVDSPEVATVDLQGEATGLSAGDATIKATWSQPGYPNVVITSNEAKLSVWSDTLASIEITPMTHLMPIDGTQKYKALAVYNGGKTFNVTDKVSWISESQNIATIDNNGISTGLAAGTTKISASWFQPDYPEAVVTSNRADLTVWSAALASIEITPTEHILPINGIKQYAATGIYDDGERYNITDRVNWVTTDKNIAVVDPLGVATAVSEGNTLVKATWAQPEYPETVVTSNSSTINVWDVALAHIAVTPENKTIPAGQTQQYIATAYYDGGLLDDVTSQVSWVASAPEIASINAAGLALGNTKGNTNITATWTQNDYPESAVQSNSALLTIEQPLPVTFITHANVNGTRYAIGSGESGAGFPRSGFKTAKFQLEIDGNVSNNSNYVWSSDRSWITTTDNNGNITFSGDASSSNKTATITATSRTTGVPVTYSFSINRWFINLSGNYSNDRPDNECAAQGSGYMPPENAYVTSSTSNSASARNPNGKLWDEWGNMSAYGNGWTAGYYWSKEWTGSRRYNIRLSNGSLFSASSGGGYIFCSKTL